MLRPGTFGKAGDDELPLIRASKIASESTSRLRKSKRAKKVKEKVRHDFSFRADGRLTSRAIRKEEKLKELKSVEGQERRVAKKIKKEKEKKRILQAIAITAPPEADEKTKRKIEKIKEKILRLQEKRDKKRKKQFKKWEKRLAVLDKWAKRDAAKKAGHDRKLSQWLEKDEKEAARRAAEIEKIKTLPDFAERKARLEAQWTKRDAHVKSARAHQEETFAEQEARRLARREHAQRRRDQMYNFFGQFLGWPQRPLITPTE